MNSDSNFYDAKPISVPTLSRLPGYYYYLKAIAAQGREYVSCSHIAKHLDKKPIQVRKDLESIGAKGKPKVGYDVRVLIKIISRTLGYDNVREAFLVGAGNLGKALLGYSAFEDYGLNIVAAFDTNPDLVGIKISEKPVFPLERFAELAKRMNIKMGIITVPLDTTQDIANIMVQAGIKAIWNFAPVHIKVPEDIIVQNVNMASSLAVLSNRLQKKEQDK